MAAPRPTHIDDEKTADLDHVEGLSHIQSPVDDIAMHKAAGHGVIGTGADDSAKILAEAGDIEYTVAEEKALVRKIDLWVLTPMMLIYTLQQMDKSSISYAAVFGIQAATGLVGTEYSWLTSILYLAQLFCQPISSYALVRLPMAKWITFNVFCWGTCVAAMAAAKNFTGLMVTRFFLGAFEATVAPTFIAITQLWWRRREQSYRTTCWLIANSLAAIFGPLISFGIGKATSNGSAILPHQGIFIFLGVLTVGVVPLLFWMLPDDISSARFLNTPRMKAIAVERLRANNTGTKTSVWKMDQVKEALLDPKSWAWFFLLMITAIPSGGFGSFGGLITKGFGFDSFTAILFQMPIGVMQIMILVFSTWMINKYKVRFLPIAIVAIFPIGGAVGMLYIDRKNPNGLLGAYYICQLLGCIQPLLYSWSNMNAGGTTKQRVTTAMLFVGQCVGNIIGPQVYLSYEAPLYKTGLYVNIACWCLDVIGIVLMGFYLMYLNKKQEKRRAALGKVSVVQDVSIMTLEDAERYQKVFNAEAAAKGEIINEDAFSDLTDWQNPSFIYVI